MEGDEIKILLFQCQLDLSWTIVRVIILFIHRMGQGTDVVRIHILNLHVISLGDGYVMQTSTIIFSVYTK